STLSRSLRFFLHFFFLLLRRPPLSPLFPYTTLFRSLVAVVCLVGLEAGLRVYCLVKPNADVEFFRYANLMKANVNGSREEFHVRSEEHTSELQSLAYLVCRLLLEKKKKNSNIEKSV